MNVKILFFLKRLYFYAAKPPQIGCCFPAQLLAVAGDAGLRGHLTRLSVLRLFNW